MTMAIEKKRLCINLEADVYDTLIKMVEKYKLPISDIVNEIIKKSNAYFDFINSTDFSLYLAKKMKDYDNKVRRERKQREKAHDDETDY